MSCSCGSSFIVSRLLNISHISLELASEFPSPYRFSEVIPPFSFPHSKLEDFRDLFWHFCAARQSAFGCFPPSLVAILAVVSCISDSSHQIAIMPVCRLMFFLDLQNKGQKFFYLFLSVLLTFFWTSQDLIILMISSSDGMRLTPLILLADTKQDRQTAFSSCLYSFHDDLFNLHSDVALLHQRVIGYMLYA